MQKARITLTVDVDLYKRYKVLCTQNDTTIQKSIRESMVALLEGVEEPSGPDEVVIEDNEEPEVTDVQRGETSVSALPEMEGPAIRLRRIKDGQEVEVPWNAWNCLTDKQKAHYELLDNLK